ncbi:MAG TPA: TetR/AcrR family transcriptional regulator [Blastocatellia bacterium]|nr:TetR/AcrR family transcriptional regulator [Blastocatellia bacterium]
MKRHYATGADTRLRIIQAAADLFHKQGVHLTSPDQIIEASGTGKGQFYYYFKNKEGLVHEVLQNHLEMIKTNQAPVSYNVNSWQELEQCFLMHIELQKRFDMTRGCPIGTVGNEVTEHDELIRQDVSLIFEVIKNKFAAFFIREKAKGNLSDDANEEQLANFCIATLQGAMLLGKVQRSSRPVEAAIREALEQVQRYVIKSRKRGEASKAQRRRGRPKARD